MIYPIKTLYCFLLISTSSIVLFAQTLTPKQDKRIRQTIAQQFGAVYNTQPMDKGGNTFVISGKDTFYNPEGLHYVFKLTGDSAQRLDHCIWHGGNFRRFLFSYQNTIYALGGYGFFTTNNNLEYFNTKIKEWSFKPTTGQVPPFINGVCFKHGDAVYSMNNFKTGNETGPDVFDSCVYKLNLKTMIWEAYTSPDAVNKVIGVSYYFKNYSVFQLNQSCSFVIKPSEMKYLLFSNEDYGILHASELYAIHDNLFILKTEGTTHTPVIDTLDFDEIWAQNKDKIRPIQLVPLLKQHSINSAPLWWVVVAIMAVVAIALLALMVIKKKTNKTSTITVAETEALPEPELEKTQAANNTGELPSDLYALLCQSDKTILVTEELDELLGISHLEPDSKKLKRHRLLSELEKNHPGFISRTKDPIDKRRFTYQLTKPTH